MYCFGGLYVEKMLFQIKCNQTHTVSSFNWSQSFHFSTLTRRSDMTFAVDWALRNNYLSIYPYPIDDLICPVLACAHSVDDLAMQACTAWVTWLCVGSFRAQQSFLFSGLIGDLLTYFLVDF